jgi:hypothetical protein
VVPHAHTERGDLRDEAVLGQLVVGQRSGPGAATRTFDRCGLPGHATARPRLLLGYHRLRLKFHFSVFNQLIYIIPIPSAWLSDFNVCAIRKTYCVKTSCSQALYITRRIFNVDVRADLLLLLHEAQVMIWNTVLVEPFDCLLDSQSMKIVDEKSMRDYTNVIFFA